MESRNELKEIGIKNRTYYYFGDIKRIRVYIFITFHTNHTKLSWVQNHCVLDRFIKIYDGIMM